MEIVAAWAATNLHRTGGHQTHTSTTSKLLVVPKDVNVASFGLVQISSVCISEAFPALPFTGVTGSACTTGLELELDEDGPPDNGSPRSGPNNTAMGAESLTILRTEQSQSFHPVAAPSCEPDQAE